VLPATAVSAGAAVVSCAGVPAVVRLVTATSSNAGANARLGGVDRGNANLASHFTALHPAVLRLIHSTVEVADQHGMELGVCGEMGSQPLMAFALIGLGLRQLSVAPRSVAVIKRLVRGLSTEIAREAALAALKARTAAEAERELWRRLHAAFGEAAFLEHGLPAPTNDNNIRNSAGLN